MGFTNKQLCDELVEEAQLLLKMAMETAGKPLGDDVDPDYIQKLRDEYHDNAPQGTVPTARGRARISCG